MKIYLMAMAVRLFEMKRVLKPTGSIYLHCDPTASHYLKLVMDSLFGKPNFRNEIVWQRYNNRSKGSQHPAKSWGRHNDTLLFYTLSSKTRVRPFRTISEDEAKERFPRIDSKGRRYTTIAHFCGKNMGPRPNLCYEWRGFTNPHPSGWRISKQRLESEYSSGAVVIKDNGKLERRRFYDPSIGVKVSNLWFDIPPIKKSEDTGYPTQKPLRLLHRIIKASSNEGDIILDPFCGCATACVAAEQLGRQWIGVDISPDAEVITKLRLQEITEGAATENSEQYSQSLFNPLSDVNVEKTPPPRTDVTEPSTQIRLPSAQTHKNELFGLQEGKCAGCRLSFAFRNLTIDHIRPRSQSGTDHKDNLQLLCQACNSTKGTGTQEELISKLKARGDLAALSD